MSPVVTENEKTKKKTQKYKPKLQNIHYVKSKRINDLTLCE